MLKNYSKKENDFFHHRIIRWCIVTVQINSPRLLECKKEQGIHFYEGILDSAMLDKWYKKSNGGLLVLDDHMDEGSGDQRVLDLFTKDSHHRRITVIYMNQDMFPKGKFSKTISRNAHHIIAFKDPRDQLGVRILTQQAFPQEFKDMLNVYREATERPYDYLLFDLHPSSSDHER